MLTLDEARELQVKYQRSAIFKFSIFLIIIISMFLVLQFTNYLTQYNALYAVFVILIFLAIKNSKIYILLQHKEFFGTIKYSNINMEPVKKFASHQPGVTYASNDVPMLYLIVINQDGKKISRNVTYNWTWGEYRVGYKVAILRFIEQPILCID